MPYWTGIGFCAYHANGEAIIGLNFLHISLLLNRSVRLGNFRNCVSKLQAEVLEEKYIVVTKQLEELQGPLPNHQVSKQL